MYRFVYTPYPKAKEAIQDLKKKIQEIDFKPNLAIFFLTDSLINNFGDFSKLVECNSVCMPVEGYMTPESVWTRGCLLLLIDTEYTLHVLKGTPDEVVGKMNRMKKGKFNMLIYPLLYPKSRLQAIKIILKLKRLYSNYKSDPYRVLEKASEIYQNELIYPINRMLRPFRDAGVGAISFNIFPIKMKYGLPVIAVNGKKIGRGVTVISFQNDMKSDFTDTLPERGESIQETKEIIKKEFAIGEEVFVEKKGIAVGHINGLKLSEFLESVKLFTKRHDISQDLQDGKFSAATPYALYFISTETFGGASLGLLEYPIEIYPSLFELDTFSPESLYVGEIVRGGIEYLKDEFERVSDNLTAIDQNFILMYAERIHKLLTAKKNVYSIITSYPSYTSKNLRRKYLSEIEKNICVNLTRTLVSLRLE